MLKHKVAVTKSINSRLPLDPKVAGSIPAKAMDF
jgi:hypothetical protein